MNTQADLVACSLVSHLVPTHQGIYDRRSSLSG